MASASAQRCLPLLLAMTLLVVLAGGVNGVALPSTTTRLVGSKAKKVAVAAAIAVTKRDTKQLSTTSRQIMTDIQNYGRRSCDLVNSIRAQYGLGALWYSGTLTERAYSHSLWMGTYNFFTHQNLGGVWFHVYDRTYGVNRILQATGENIATSAHRSPDVANDFHWQWVYSPPHFQNMLSAAHTHCGTGFAYVNGLWWATQLFGVGQFGNEFGGQTPA